MAIVLCVDDDNDVLRALEILLETLGHDFIGAESGEDALEILSLEPANIVIADWEMPGMDGIEFLSIVRRRYPEMICIVLTVYQDFEVAVGAINDVGVFRFLVKPWENDALRAALTDAVNELRLRGQPELKRAVTQQEAMVSRLEETFPGIAEVERDEDGSILLMPMENEALEELLAEYKAKT